MSKNSLLTDFSCDDNENLPSQTKPTNFNLLLYFFCKKLKNIFSMEINGNSRKRGKEQ